jgi:hypothetical protein
MVSDLHYILESIKYFGMSKSFEVEIFVYDESYNIHTVIKAEFKTFNDAIHFIMRLECDNMPEIV